VRCHAIPGSRGASYLPEVCVTLRATALLLLLTPVAAAQAALSPADKQFIQQAGIGGTHEVQLSLLADKRSSDQEVRRFARRMLDDHSKASAELKAILSHRNISAPDGLMDPEHTAIKERLRELGGPEFDRLYIVTMVRDHAQAVAQFEAEARGGGDADVKAFAARQLPTIREHLAHATRIALRYSDKSRQ
jgi:putative membrane protein